MDNMALIREFLQQRLGIDPARITPDTSLKDLNVDSLILLDMMFDLEEKTGIVLTKNLPTVHTLGELDTLLCKLQQE